MMININSVQCRIQKTQN